MIIGSSENAIGYLNGGKIIGYPTEGVYGLGCDPWNMKTVSKIGQIKKREPNKLFLLVASKVNHLEALIDIDSISNEVISSWPGHTTWLIPAKKNVPIWLVNQENGLIAVRVSKHPIINQLCNKFNKPIISTSANLSGNNNIMNKKEFIDVFSETVDYLVEGDLGNSNKPSIIMNMITGERIR
tara:strand:+ start:718 stop:1266 length:549 start_codon:yes stop_codon:yes gene_type:complete